MFLQYINTAATKWNVHIRVHAIRHIILASWDTFQNKMGHFEMALMKYQRDLLTQKERCCAAFAVEKDDIVHLES